METKTYNIRITPINDNAPSYIIEITTSDIEWSMSQYHRNRDPFNWEIIE